MKKLFSRLHRSLLLILALLPVVSVVMRWLTVNLFTGVGIWMMEMFLLSMITLLPAYVGSYREYEVVSYENARNNDPNPDREVVHTLMSEGHRFPIRLVSDIAFMVLSICIVLFLPREWFVGASLTRKLFFILVCLIFQLVAAKELPSPVFIWSDIAGVLLGSIAYLALAVYLHFSKNAPPALQTLISVSAVLYLFLGTVALNKQSILLSMSAHQGEGQSVPKQIVIRNRRIVISFASLVTIVSLIDPIRRFFAYLAQKLGWLLSRIFGLHSAPVEAPAAFHATMPEPVQMAGEMYEETAGDMSLLSKIVVYGFLGLVALGFLYVVFDGIKKLADKLTKWLEQLVGNVSEGFYDEKEELMSADEMRDQIKNNLLSGIKNLFARETPWRELDGRERTRRLLKLFYKKRAGKISNLRAKTAKEAIFEGDAPDGSREAFYRMYDLARYSDHPVKSEEADALKKDLKL